MSELLIVLLIVLVLFGAGKIPRIAEDMGKGVKAFKKGISDDDDEEKPEEKSSCCCCSCNSDLDAKIAEAKAEVAAEADIGKEQEENAEEKTEA
jgi:sec-independent protein translocase protein TatA